MEIFNRRRNTITEEDIKFVVSRALHEDIGARDITTDNIIPGKTNIDATLIGQDKR